MGWDGCKEYKQDYITLFSLNNFNVGFLLTLDLKKNIAISSHLWLRIYTGNMSKQTDLLMDGQTNRQATILIALNAISFCQPNNRPFRCDYQHCVATTNMQLHWSPRLFHLLVYNLLRHKLKSNKRGRTDLFYGKLYTNEFLLPFPSYQVNLTPYQYVLH